MATEAMTRSLSLCASQIAEPSWSPKKIADQFSGISSVPERETDAAKKVDVQELDSSSCLSAH
jgi:hypothetical protein